MACIHDVFERDVAVDADGFCPLCQTAKIEELRAALSELAGKTLKIVSKATQEKVRTALRD